MSLRTSNGSIVSTLGPTIPPRARDTEITELLDWDDEDETDTEVMQRNPERLDTVIARVLAEAVKQGESQ